MKVPRFISKVFSKKEEEPEAPGWDAIDASLERIHGDQVPRHRAAQIPYSLGGSDPLQGVSVYLVPGPPRHWHYVTYGFTELFVKETKNPKVSGYGFELTFRLVSDTEETPSWPCELLQDLARYVFRTGQTFSAGDHAYQGGELAKVEATELCAFAVVQDPQLDPTSSSLGSFSFLQLVGLTQDEYELVQTRDTLSFLDLVRQQNPLLVTDFKRISWLRDPAIRQAAEEAREREGSSTGVYFVKNNLAWVAGASGIELEIDQDTVSKLQLQFLSRRRDRRIDLERAGVGVRFAFGDPAGWREDGSWLVITLGQEQAAALAAGLDATPGRYEFTALPFLKIAVAEPEAADGEKIQEEK